MKRRIIQVAVCAIFAVTMTQGQNVVPETPSDAEGAVLATEAAFSTAKIHNDVAALAGIVANDYIGLNQWGARRDKAAVLELFRTFPTTSLVPSSLNVRVSGDIAIVDGIMLESNAWKFLFLRTYVKRQGRWQLISSVQTFPLTPDMRPIDPSLLFAQ